VTTPLHLTPEQRRIVEHDEGPLVVIAGAGTGKTRVIVERVRHLLATHDDLLPEQLLVLTYNVKAARELQERIDAAVGPAIRGRMTVERPQLLSPHPVGVGRGRRHAAAPRRARWHRPVPAPAGAAPDPAAGLPQRPPPPGVRQAHQPRQGRAGRLRATELIGLLEGTDPADPETPAARERLAVQLAAIARAVDPLTLRDVAGADLPGASLLAVVPLPSRFSHSAFNVYDACPTRYAFQYLYRIPGPETPVAALTFGGIAHETFEAFTRERRERAARGEPPPSRSELESVFRARWTPTGFPDKTAEEHYQRRVATLLDNFLAGEAAAEGEVIAEEQGFELTLVPEDGRPPFIVSGSIDRIDRLPSGRVEVIDYKTGKISSQKGVDESLQLSIYALACREVLGLGTPERVTLSFTESATRMSTTRTDEQLDAARADLLARAAQIRSGAFAATPGEACRWCDFARLCPSRAR
jgi:RecB family exonuclease